MARPPRRFLRVALTLVVVAVVAIFFGRTLVQNWEALADVDWRPDGWGALAIVLLASAVLVSGLLWGRMTAELSGADIPVAEAIRVHCASWLLKYVPGQVGSAVNKVVWASGRGISKTLVTLTFVYENVFLLLASIVPPGIVLLLAGNWRATDSDLLLVAAASVLPLLLVTNARLFRWACNLVARRILKRDVPPTYFLVPQQALRYQFLYLVPRVVNGAGFVAIAVSMLDVPASTYLPLASAYILAGAVGLLAVFVPSGIGVRESVIVLLATPYMPVEQAVVLSLAARLYATVADIVVAALYGTLRISGKRERNAV